MKPAKIRLLESQFVGYTGVLCGVQFKDGVSVSELPFIDQQRVCSSMRATTVDGVNVSPSAAYSNRDDISVDKINEPSAPEMISFKKQHEIAKENEKEKEKKAQLFSREKLEEIADLEGIAGLRVIGNRLGVKAKGIVEMIEGILKAQGGA
ncbi:hypothetical protein U2H75_003022 [Escherichia coli]|nr:hypothetical protein [Escherichia coli]HAX2345274.1 hypothetical protein [Escherichia coli]HBN7237016.1 hypothetical protein [Escherichia coli]HBN7443551.1 hypothetical protein [Escherichia coli]HBQ4879990.1 hypothetical protein [Escherichia coli]